MEKISIIAKSKVFKETIRTVSKFALTDANILLTGSTGAGKSYIAKYIHQQSLRASGPFFKINCANLTETLLESELFGHERGAFTGAVKRKIGIFESADKGTLFLDEIGDIPLSIQVKLLRVLEDKSFERVGGNITITSNARIISATNKDLVDAVVKGLFREDLFYRLNILPICIPDLSERSSCKVPLACSILESLCKKYKREDIHFSELAVNEINRYNWPGNVRQLSSLIEKALILSEGNCIESLLDESTVSDTSKVNITPTLESNEKEVILDALKKCLWVQKDAAKLLGVSPRCLNYKIAKFNITHHNWRRHKQ